MITFRVEKQYISRPRKPASLCKMKGCKEKRYINSNKFKQSYCLDHCKQFGKVL